MDLVRLAASLDWIQTGKWVIAVGALGGGLLVVGGATILFPIQVKFAAPEATFLEIYAVLIDCFVDAFFKPAVKEYRNVPTKELWEMINSSEPPIVVDTRTEQDFRDGHIPGSMFIPFNTFRHDYHVLPKDKPIVIACQFGHYSVVAVNMMLREGGYSEVYDYSEGLEEWTKQKKPQAKGLPPGYKPRRKLPGGDELSSLGSYKSFLTDGDLRKPVYLDNNATTPIDPRVLQVMMPHLTFEFGNAASRTHSLGTNAENAVYTARQQVAEAIHAASPKEIVFTSGASESNNLAIKGVAYAARQADKERNHIITCVTEHKAVLDTCKTLEDDGFTVTYMNVRSDGLIDCKELAEHITSATILVTIMLANNEIGVIQPFREIGKLCRERGVLFHSDGTQGVGKVDLNVQRDHIDLLSVSAHKIYGPKGVGALYVQSGVKIMEQINGGGHEFGMRSGTLNVPGIVGLGECCSLAVRDRIEECKRIEGLRDSLLEKLTSSIPDHQVNGTMTNRLAGNLHISFAGVTSEETLMELSGDVAISSGSACNSRKTGPSHVVVALNIGPDMIGCTLRFGVGRFTTQAEIDFVAKRVIEVVTATRKRKMKDLERF